MSRGTVTDEDLVIPHHDWASIPWDAIQDSVYTTQRHWIDCLTSGRAPETSGQDTLRLLDITLGAYASAENSSQYQVGDLS